MRARAEAEACLRELFAEAEWDEVSDGPYPDPITASRRDMYFHCMMGTTVRSTDFRPIRCGGIYAYAHPSGTPVEHDGRGLRTQCRVILRTSHETTCEDVCWCIDLATGERVVLPTDRLVFVRNFEDASPDEQASWVAQFGFVYMHYQPGSMYDYAAHAGGRTVARNSTTRRVVPVRRTYDYAGHAMVDVVVLDEPVYYVTAVPARLLVRAFDHALGQEAHDRNYQVDNPADAQAQLALAREAGANIPWHTCAGIPGHVRRRHRVGMSGASGMSGT